MSGEETAPASAAAERISMVESDSMRIVRIAMSLEDLQLELLPKDPAVACAVVVVQMAGSSSYAQRQSTVRLQKAQWAVFEPGALRLFEARSSEQLLLLFPRARLITAKRTDLLPVPGRALGCPEATSSLLLDTARSLIEDLRRAGAVSARTVEQNLFNVLRRCLHECLAENAVAHSRDARTRERTLLYIQAHLRDPDLTIRKLAQHLGCSERYLHKVFARAGEKIGRYIVSQRLERCREEILSPQLTTLPLTRIAMSWGFNYPPNFSRAYRQRFGISPKDDRRKQLGRVQQM